ncbi:MAG: NAD(P)-dependent oxidoreductase [Patescibacteria group bacterium]
MSKNNKINVLVVGGAGYIGGAVTDHLINKKIPFSVYDALIYEHQYLKPVNFIYGDVRDRLKLKTLLPKYSHVIWLAAIVGDTGCQVDEFLTNEVNTTTVSWLVKNYKGRILFASTCSVYGMGNEILTEESLTQPLSLYARSKLTSESYLLKHPNALIYRIGTAFGASDIFSRVRLDLAVNVLSLKAINEGKFVYFGGTQWRPFIHVRDIGHVFVNGLFSDARGIHNISSDNYQIKEVAKRIAEITKCKAISTEHPFEDNRNYHVSTKKAKDVGLFKNIKFHSLDDGISQIVAIAREKRVFGDVHDVHFNERHLSSLLNDKKKLWSEKF